MTTFDLFAPSQLPVLPACERLGEQAVVLRGWALRQALELCDAMARITQAAAFRHMQTPGGRSIGIAVTNCGDCGWISDARGYRYVVHDPLTGQPWPPLPALLVALARSAAAAAGFADFTPDTCLINCYVPGTRLTLHQDRNERDFSAPIVSVSLGLPATFVFGGAQRRDPLRRVLLQHGDVVVWGGVDRLRYHGVLPLADGMHPRLGQRRVNLTLRQAR